MQAKKIRVRVLIKGRAGVKTLHAPDLEKKMISDCIRKSDLLNRISKCHYDTEKPLESYTRLFNEINNVPTVDAEPVIHCKDCKYTEDHGKDHVCIFFSMEVYDSDYCIGGETP